MKFLSDESVDFRIVEFLRDQDQHVSAVIEQQPGISDSEVLQISNDTQAIPITEDKDFGELVFRQKLSHSGVLLLRFQDSLIEEKLTRIMFLLQNHVDDLKESFVVLTANSLRIRKS